MSQGPASRDRASAILLTLPEPRSPEGRLVLAVLLDAVALLREDAFARARHPRASVRSTIAWILADDTGWPLSFVNVCRALGLEPDTMRQALFDELAEAPGWLERLRGGRVTPLPSRCQPAGATSDTGASSSLSTNGPAASHFDAARRPESYIASSTSRSK